MRRVEPTAPINQVLGTGDILLAFDGTAIANDGTVPFRSGERISFSYLVSRKYTGDEVRPSPQGLLSVVKAGRAPAGSSTFFVLGQTGPAPRSHVSARGHSPSMRH